MGYREKCASIIQTNDPWELIESGGYRCDSISKDTAGQKIPLTPETMKPGQLRIYNTVKKALRHSTGKTMECLSAFLTVLYIRS